jgi:hypothetical protein
VELTQAKRFFFVGLIVSLSATAFLAILFLLFAEFDETAERILLTTLLLSLFSLFALPAGVLLDQGRYVTLAWAVITLSSAAFALAMFLTWGDWEDGGDDESIWKALATLAAFAAAASQAAMTTSRLRAGDSPTVRLLYLGSLGLAGLLALMVAIAAWEEIDDDAYYRGLGAVAIADLLLVIVQSLARRVGAVAGGPERGGHRVVFVVDRAPSAAAIEEATSALEREGVRVTSVDTGR